MTDNLLNDGSHLVDLDGEDDEVLALVLVLLRRLAEALVCLLDSVVEDVGEAKQDRSRHMTRRQLVHNFLEVHLHAVLLGRDIDVSFLVDAEVIDSPAFDVVELLRVLNTPLLHFNS